MASGNNLMEKLQDEVSCSICLEYLKDPVTIDCGHNFCCMCISDYCERWSTAGAALCPQCRAGFLQSTFRPNRQLANIVEGFEQLALQTDKEPMEKLCEKHGKKLHLFCEDDGEAICLVCDKSREHRSHTVIPIEEAAQDYKVGLRLSTNTGWIGLVLMGACVERRDQFLKPAQALEEEKQLLLQRLEEDEEETLRKLQENTAFLVEQSSSLVQLMSEIEQKCQQPAADLAWPTDALHTTISLSSCPHHRKCHGQQLFSAAVAFSVLHHHKMVATAAFFSAAGRLFSATPLGASVFGLAPGCAAHLLRPGVRRQSVGKRRESHG
uniref:RING-type E3 ubiquitin transferase n=1 Tax=Pelusios castaneus TaxID=367368 RepID=A0A8C8SBM0_9SAUR